MSEFTVRQREVLGWLASDKSYPEIGDELGIRADVVRDHVRTCGFKLGVRGPSTRDKVLAAAIERGLLDA